MQNSTSWESRNVTISAHGQQRVLLGKYLTDDELKGFSVQIKPESLPKEDISTQVVRIDDPGSYRLYMNIVNYSDKTVHITIDRLQ